MNTRLLAYQAAASKLQQELESRNVQISAQAASASKLQADLEEAKSQNEQLQVEIVDHVDAFMSYGLQHQGVSGLQNEKLELQTNRMYSEDQAAVWQTQVDAVMLENEVRMNASRRAFFFWHP